MGPIAVLLYDINKLALYAKDNLFPDRRSTCSIISRRDGDAWVSEQVLVACGVDSRPSTCGIGKYVSARWPVFVRRAKSGVGVSYWVTSAMRLDE